MKDRKGILIKLFFSMLEISAFTFGGGFVIISLMKKRFVDVYHYLDEDEMLDMTALAQASPGPIAVNSAILVGYRVQGLPGMIVSVLGTIIPPTVIISIISIFYRLFATNLYVTLVLRGMQAGVAAIIADVVFSLGSKVVKEENFVHDAMILLSFIAVYFLHLNVAIVILLAGLIGFLESRFERSTE